MSARYALGIGATSDASAADVLALLRLEIGPLKGVTILATVDRRAALARTIATILQLDLVLFSAQILSRVSDVTTVCSHAACAVGTASVAEAAALSALGPTARLVFPRRKGHRCTCALAELP